MKPLLSTTNDRALADRLAFAILLAVCSVFFNSHNVKAQAPYLIFNADKLDYWDTYMVKSRRFDSVTIDELTKTKTVFFYKNEDSSRLDLLKELLVSAWSMSELIFSPFSDFDKYACNDNYSYLVIESWPWPIPSDNRIITQYYLSLRTFKYCKYNYKMVTEGLYRIELTPDDGAGNCHFRGNGFASVWQLYQTKKFGNWSPMLLKAKLQVANSNLKNKIRPDLYKNIRAAQLAELLAKDTLYVPESLMTTFYEKNSQGKAAEYFNEYKYSYRICSDDELYEIFEKEKRGRLLFEYVQSYPDRYVTVYDLKDKQVVYKKYTTGYTLRPKDIRKIE